VRDMAGNRVKGRNRPKPKSVKAKAVNLSSKRRLSRMGKEQQKGKSGIAAHYVSRNKAMKMLQITLRDFRRLCILKGIYPRDPKKKPNKDKNKTYYHIKDISYLAHEPLLAKFRSFKTFMKKVRKRLAKNEHQDANRMYDKKPEYTLDHLVRERYPRFADSLEDLDDGLCLMHLFANLPSIGSIRVERTEAALRFCREWQLYVAQSRSLRKVFVSVKGIYYQAEVQGVTVTWLVPHKFSQNLPSDVDFRVMLTFLEFYETLLGFVLFKLYHSVGLRYPPKLLTNKDEDGAHLNAIQAVPTGSAMDTEETNESKEKLKPKKKKKKSNQEIESEGKLESLKDALKNIGKAVEEKEESADDQDKDGEEEKQVFAGDEGQAAIQKNHERIEALTNLFKGMRFWLSREVPYEPLEFCITAFGGKILSADSGCDISDASITHHVTDRETVKDRVKSREYIQPQWVFDCVNSKLILPVSRYAPEAKDLPPHLSPFVDNAAEGYMPLYAEEINKLRAARDSVSAPSGLKLQTKEESKKQREETFKTTTEMGEGDEGEDSEDDSEDEAESRYNEELAAEKRGEKSKTEIAKMEVEEDSSEEEEEEEEEEEKKESADEEEEMEEKEQEKVEDSKVEKTVSKLASKDKKKMESFIAKRRFQGHRKGYVFRNGENGLGYYLDTFANAKVTFKPSTRRQSKRAQRLAQKKEEEEMRHMMMSKKAKRLYGRMQHGRKKKQEKVDALKRKRAALSSSSKRRKSR